jgi:hypothetical protein
MTAALFLFFIFTYFDNFLGVSEMSPFQTGQRTLIAAASKPKLLANVRTQILASYE